MSDKSSSLSDKHIEILEELAFLGIVFFIREKKDCDSTYLETGE